MESNLMQWLKNQAPEIDPQQIERIFGLLDNTSNTSHSIPQTENTSFLSFHNIVTDMITEIQNLIDESSRHQQGLTGSRIMVSHENNDNMILVVLPNHCEGLHRHCQNNCPKASAHTRALHPSRKTLDPQHGIPMALFLNQHIEMRIWKNTNKTSVFDNKLLDESHIMTAYNQIYRHLQNKTTVHKTWLPSTKNTQPLSQNANTHKHHTFTTTS